MRIAAGTLMIIGGWALSIIGITSLYDFAFGVSITVSAIFVVTGGVFCLMRKYWKICFASALLLFVLSALSISLIAVLWSLPAPDLPGALPAPLPIGLLIMVVGIPPAILVYLSRREWSESQA